MLVLVALLTAAYLVLAILRLMSAAYPSDHLDCPIGSQRWGRWEQGRLVYACFDPGSAKATLGGR